MCRVLLNEEPLRRNRSIYADHSSRDRIKSPVRSPRGWSSSSHDSTADLPYLLANSLRKRSSAARARKPCCCSSLVRGEITSRSGWITPSPFSGCSVGEETSLARSDGLMPVRFAERRYAGPDTYSIEMYRGGQPSTANPAANVDGCTNSRFLHCKIGLRCHMSGCRAHFAQT